MEILMYTPFLALFVHLGLMVYFSPYNKKYSERYSATKEEAEWTERMRLQEKYLRENGDNTVQRIEELKRRLSHCKISKKKSCE